MTVRIYKHTDAGAPQLLSGDTASGLRSNLPAVLKACLVTGYGGKQAAGWTQDWQVIDGANIVKTSFKQGTGGDNLHIVLDDTLSSDTACKVMGTSSSLSEGSYTEPFPTNINDADGTWFKTGYYNETTVRGWIVIASPTYFYFFNMPIDGDNNKDYHLSGNFFGSIEKILPASPSSGAIVARKRVNPHGDNQAVDALFKVDTLDSKFLQKDFVGLHHKSLGVNIGEGAVVADQFLINPLTGKIDIIKPKVIGRCQYGYLPNSYIGANTQTLSQSQFVTYVPIGFLGNSKKVAIFSIPSVSFLTYYIEYDE